MDLSLSTSASFSAFLIAIPLCSPMSPQKNVSQKFGDFLGILLHKLSPFNDQLRHILNLSFDIASRRNNPSNRVKCLFFHKKRPYIQWYRAFSKAESQGFEPRVPLGTMVFKTIAFDHSANSPSSATHQRWYFEGDFHSSSITFYDFYDCKKSPLLKAIKSNKSWTLSFNDDNGLLTEISAWDNSSF